MAEMRKVQPEKAMGLEPAKPQEKFYPTIHLNFETLPEAKKWKVGNMYRITLELKQTSLDLHEGSMGEHGGAGFEIHGIQVLTKKAGKRVPRYKEEQEDDDE